MMEQLILAFTSGVIVGLVLAYGVIPPLVDARNRALRVHVRRHRGR